MVLQRLNQTKLKLEYLKSGFKRKKKDEKNYFELRRNIEENYFAFRIRLISHGLLNSSIYILKSVDKPIQHQDVL